MVEREEDCDCSIEGGLMRELYSHLHKASCCRYFEEAEQFESEEMRSQTEELMFRDSFHMVIAYLYKVSLVVRAD